MSTDDTDWDTVMEQRAEMERDARACPECHGNGWTEGPGCNCGAPWFSLSSHEPYCGLEPCPRGCPFVGPAPPQSRAEAAICEPDDFVQDRHADLDPNADEAEPEPADRDWDRD